MSLRTKLFVSYAAIIVLALVLAGGASVVLRSGERERAELDRLAVAAPAISFDIFRLHQAGASAEQIDDYLTEQGRLRDVRVLLLDRNDMIAADSQDSLRGRKLAIPSTIDERGPFDYQRFESDTLGSGYIFLVLRPRVMGGGRFGPGRTPSSPDERVVVAVPRETIARAWLGLLPGLLWAGLLALALSAVVAVVLSRSIAQPLRALTRASEEMARGNYDQEIALRRGDEVGRLAAAFNAMARQVGRSHVQMRALIANVSHDLKTPLTSIMGFSQALRDGAVEGPEQAKETGAIIHEEAERVGMLVNDLLFLSEIEAGQVVVTREDVDLSALAGRAARRFEPALRERGVSLTASLPLSLPVRGDSAKLERVLDNLLDNARKYTPDGGRVTLEGRQEDGARPTVWLSVFNSGSYIAPEDLPKVFERFSRLDRARTRATGSGLGLAIARELVDLHGGALTAASDSTGTTFTVTLPAPAAPRSTTGVAA